MAYVTAEELIARLGNRIQPDGKPLITAAVAAASNAIDQHCRQTFTKATSATARVYAPSARDEAYTDPFWTTTGLVIQTDDNDDGVFETTWAAAGYELDMSLGGLAHVLDAPYDTIRALDTWFPTTGRRRRTLQVTAQWGWASTPSNVIEATKILAHDLWKRKDVAFGISTQSAAEFGGLRIGRDVLAQVESLLQDLVRMDRAGIA